MKRALLILLISAQIALGTMPNNMVLEVRPGTGADTNSGAFATLLSDNTTILVGGTDWTQQAAAHVTFDGVTITAITSGASATITITGYTVATTDVANTLRISGGTNFTTGLYQVVSVNVGLSTWTLDRNVSTGVGAAMTGKMGGALATLGQSFSDMSTIGVTGFGGDCTIWYKAGTDTITSGLSQPSVYGLIVHGYQTTRGDNTGTRPLLTTATNSVNMITGSATNGSNTAATFMNVSFSNTAGTRGAGFFASSSNLSPGVALINCVLDGFSYGVFGDNGTNVYWSTLVIYQTEIKNSVNDGVKNAGTSYFIGSYIHGNGADGINLVLTSNCAGVIDSSVIASNTTAGLELHTGNKPYMVVSKNSVYYSNGTAGLLINNSQQGAQGLLANNIFQANGTYGINNTGASGSYLSLGALNRFNNAFFNNTTAATISMPTEASDITLSANPFVSAGSNFALNSTAGGGAALKAAGFPGTLPAGVGTGFLDVGALQSQCTGGSSSPSACAFAQ